MTTDLAEVQETAALEMQASKLALEEATGVTISSVEEYQVAGGTLHDIKKRRVQVETVRKGILRPFDEARDGIMTLFRPIIENLQRAENLVKASMLDWEGKEKRRRQEEEAAAREAQRIEQERLRAQAEAAETEGDETKATVLQEMAEDVPLQTAAPVERAAGTSVRQVWRAEVTDMRKLLQAVMLGRAPLELVMINMPLLNELAREKKDAFDVPGAKAVMKEIMAARGG